MYLLKYTGRRLLTLIPVLFGITFMAFFLGRISPGDPVEAALSQIGIEVPTIEQQEEMAKKLGLNDSILSQYGRWLNNVLHGDLGKSYLSQKDIGKEFARRLPVTLKVSMLALCLAVTLGVSLGLLMAAKKDRLTDKLLRGLSVLLLSIPGFWLAILMIIVFAEKLRWLPTSGNGGLRYMIMPAFVLASSTVGTTARVTRSSLLQEMGEHYIAAARSKGLTNRMLTMRHALANSLMPIITLIGNYLGGILGGSFIVESIFSLNGIGSYVLTGISSRDYPIVQAYVLFMGGIYVLVTLLIDICYMLVNPKVRLEGVGK